MPHKKRMTPPSQSGAGNSFAMANPVPLIGKLFLMMARMILPKASAMR